MSARLLGELQFISGLIQPPAQAFLRLCPTATQSRFQFFNGRGRKEQESRIQIGLFDLFYALFTWISPMSHIISRAGGTGKYKGSISPYLHFNIQDTYSAFLSNVLYGLNAGAVVVSTELCMLDEPIAVHKVKKILLGRVEVFTAMFFAWPWGTGGV